MAVTCFYAYAALCERRPGDGKKERAARPALRDTSRPIVTALTALMTFIYGAWRFASRRAESNARAGN